MTAQAGVSYPAPRVSVVIPALNEALNLPHVFARMPTDIYEVILVDGHSVDNTVAVARGLWPSVRIVKQTRSGKGNALACGFAAATGDVIAMIDADGSADPGEIPRFMQALTSGADFAKGTRFADCGGSDDITRLRSFGNRALTSIFNLCYGSRYSDLCYGFNVFWRRHASILALDSTSPALAGDERMLWGDGFEIETLIHIRVAKAGLVVTEVPSFEHSRIHGVSNLNALSDGIRVLQAIFVERGQNRSRPTQGAVPSDAARSRYILAKILPGRPVSSIVPGTAECPSGQGNVRTGGLSRQYSGPGEIEMHEGKALARANVNPSNSVTIVICAYTADRWSIFRHAVDVARKQMRFDDELIVVVDNNGPLLARCRESLDGCIVMANSRRRGLSGARNTAVSEAQGSVVAFLDDDAVPLDGWLDALRAPYADKHVYGVGGLAKAHWPNRQPTWFPEEFLWVVGCSYRGLPTDPRPVRNLMGANMSFRRSAFEEAGEFAEEMGRVLDRPLGCEETEFSIRLRQTNPNAILMFNPSAQVEHYMTEQRESVRYFVRRCWAEGTSKAEVARRVGRSSALSTERGYTSRVLPKGVWRGLSESLTGDIWGAARAASIPLGLAATAAGYCAGTYSGVSGVHARQARSRRSLWRVSLFAF
jgi:glycosyltransferase involved in cell wall biosynthesis